MAVTYVRKDGKRVTRNRPSPLLERSKRWERVGEKNKASTEAPPKKEN